MVKKRKNLIASDRKPRIAPMGLAFKPNIDDLRESPAKYIIQKVLQDSNDEEYFIVEPNIDSHKVFKLTDFKMAAEQADIVVFLVGYKHFFELELDKEKVVLDFCGVVKT